MSVRIPTATDAPAFDQTTDIGTRLYRVGVRWNGRTASWYLMLGTQGGTALVEGRRMVVGLDLLRQFTADARLPDGVLSVPDADGSHVDPGREDLGSRVHLTFEAA